jgi:ribose transport system substrate-binding protein
MRDELREQFPGVRVLGPFDTKLDPSANREAWQVLVAANPDAIAFLGTGEADGRNLAALRVERHATWVAGSFGVDMSLLLAVRTGDLSLVSPELFLQGAVAGRLQAMHTRVGATLPRGWLVVPGLVIDRGNVDAVINRQTWLFAKREWFADQLDELATNPTDYLSPLTEAG